VTYTFVHRFDFATFLLNQRTPDGWYVLRYITSDVSHRLISLSRVRLTVFSECSVVAVLGIFNVSPAWLPDHVINYAAFTDQALSRIFIFDCESLLLCDLVNGVRVTELPRLNPPLFFQDFKVTRHIHSNQAFVLLINIAPPFQPFPPPESPGYKVYHTLSYPSGTT
jgi:hypothetical protein